MVGSARVSAHHSPVCAHADRHRGEEPGPGGESPAAAALSPGAEGAVVSAPCRVRWVSMKPTRLVSRSDTRAAMSIVGSAVNPAIPATMRVNRVGSW